MDDSQQVQGIVVPFEKLSKEALGCLIEEFILREGTDYGSYEYSLSEKQEQVFRQIESGEVVVVFDPAEESTSLVQKDKAPASEPPR